MILRQDVWKESSQRRRSDVSLIFVVFICRSTWESARAIQIDIGFFLRNLPVSCTMSSAKSKSLTFSAGYLCDRRGTIVKPGSSLPR